MVWALTKAPVADPVARLVLVGLANHAGPDGRGARPAQATLARYVGVSDRTIRTKLRLLEHLGLVVEGDQAAVAHLRPDRRPVVFDLAMHLVERAEDASGREDTGGNLRPHGRKSATARAEDDDRTGGNTLPTEPSMNLSIEPSVNRVGDADDDDAEAVRSDVLEVCRIVADHVEAVTGKRPAAGARWQTQARLMLDRDGRTVDEVRAVMAWVTASAFWSPNILSVPKLRDKWDTLAGQAVRDARAASSGGGWLERELARAAAFSNGGAR